MNEEIISRKEAKHFLTTYTNSQIRSVGGDYDLEVKLELLERMKNNTRLDLLERNDIIRMRRIWSHWLLAAIMFILAFDWFFISMIGFGKMRFDQSSISVPLFMSESILKIFALAFLVVKFLFNTDNDKDKKKKKEVED